MRVRDLMTEAVEACQPEGNLAEAASIMWKRDCGVVPVVDGENRVVGVVTDRDICMNVSMQGRLASDIKVREAMSAEVRSCGPEDEVSDALDTMAREQLHRLAVVNADGTLAGVLSMCDVVRHAGKGKSKKHVSHGEAMAALKAICRPRTQSDDETPSDDDAPPDNDRPSNIDRES